MVRDMPAKPLTPEQKEDAIRLKAAFRRWQEAQADAGKAVSQAEAAHRLGFGQSALSQYLNGAIPLNGPVLTKFCALMEVAPESISQAIVDQEHTRAKTWTPLENVLERMAHEAMEAAGLEVKRLEMNEQIDDAPAWFVAELGRRYTPDFEVRRPDGSRAWVEVKSPFLAELSEDLVRLQAAHPSEFLLLMGHGPEFTGIIERWLHPVEMAVEPDRHALKNQRPVWVVGRTQGGMPERIWDDGGYPAGKTDELADVATVDEHAFACRVVGDSMVPRFMPGEYALVEPGTAPDLEDDVLVRLTTGETMLKRLLSRRGGIRLGSYNSSEVHTFKEEEITWMYYVAHPIPARRIRQRIDLTKQQRRAKREGED